MDNSSFACFWNFFKFFNGREKFLERRIQEIEEKFRKIQETIKISEKGKGRGKKSKTSEEIDIATQIDQEATRRLRSFLASERISTSSESSFATTFPQPSAPPEECSNFDQSVGEEKFVFIRKIEVLLNGTPFDQAEDKQNEDECMQAYWRMFAFNGQMNSLFTNGISYDNFRYLLCIANTKSYPFNMKI